MSALEVHSETARLAVGHAATIRLVSALGFVVGGWLGLEDGVIRTIIRHYLTPVFGDYDSSTIWRASSSDPTSVVTRGRLGSKSV